jgi:hypothetical protein
MADGPMQVLRLQPRPLAGVGEIEHAVQLPTVVHGRVGHPHLRISLCIFVHAEVVLVAIEARVILLPPMINHSHEGALVDVWPSLVGCKRRRVPGALS